MHAAFKDYKPIDFVLKVRYNHNLDGKTKFIDLGTHIFYKESALAGMGAFGRSFNFTLNNVIDSTDDDLDNFKLTVNDGLQDYLTLPDQGNVISMAGADAANASVELKPGENLAAVGQEGGVGEPEYLGARRKFFVLPGFTNNIEIPLVSKLQPGELAVVLTWM